MRLQRCSIVDDPHLGGRGRGGPSLLLSMEHDTLALLQVSEGRAGLEYGWDTCLLPPAHLLARSRTTRRTALQLLQLLSLVTCPDLLLALLLAAALGLPAVSALTAPAGQHVRAGAGMART